jgi:hypothetical protein
VSSGPSEVERYDHATAVSRGEEVARLHAFIAACAERGELRASQVAVDAHKGVRVQFGFDHTTLEFVIQGARHLPAVLDYDAVVALIHRHCAHGHKELLLEDILELRYARGARHKADASTSSTLSHEG